MAEVSDEEWVVVAVAENIRMAEYNERSKNGDPASQTEGFKKEDDDDNKLKKEEGDQKKWSPELETGAYQSGDHRCSKLDLTSLVIDGYFAFKEENDDDREQSPELVAGSYQAGDRRSSKLDLTSLVIDDYFSFKEANNDNREQSPEFGTGSYQSGDQRSYIETIKKEEGDDKKQLLELETGSYQFGNQQIEYQGFKKEHDDDREQSPEPGTGVYQSDNLAIGVQDLKKEEDDTDRDKKWPSPESGTGEEGYEGDKEEEATEKNSGIIADLGRRLIRKLRILVSSDDHAADDPQGVTKNKKHDLKMKDPMVYDEISDDDLGKRTKFQELAQKDKGLATREGGEESSKNVEKNSESAEKNNFRATQLGVRISRLLVKMMLQLSDSKKELPKFETFKHSLELINKNSSVVINKFITILETMMILVGSCSALESSQKEKSVDKLLSRFQKNIMRLKSIVEQLPEESEYLLDLEMTQCEREMEEMEREVSELMVLCPDKTWGKETDYQIDRVWRKLKD